MNDLTETQCELLFNAWALAREGKGMVIADDAVPDAHALLELGWLDYRFEENGDMSYWWTARAEAALDTNALMNSAKANVN
jgi:hypothetical protein